MSDRRPRLARETTTTEVPTRVQAESIDTVSLHFGFPYPDEPLTSEQSDAPLPYHLVARRQSDSTRRASPVFVLSLAYNYRSRHSFRATPLL